MIINKKREDLNIIYLYKSYNLIIINIHKMQSNTKKPIKILNKNPSDSKVRDLEPEEKALITSKQQKKNNQKIVRGKYVYYGNLQNGKLQGPGYIIFQENGSSYKYQGTFKNDDMIKGKIFKDGSEIYNGQLKNKKKHGSGIQRVYDKKNTQIEIYKGEFMDDNRNGQGQLQMVIEKTKYVGNFKNNYKNGSIKVFYDKNLAQYEVKKFHNDIKVDQLPELVAYSPNIFIGEYNITQKNLKSLEKGNWLYPNIICAYSYILQEAYNKWKMTFTKYKTKRVKIMNFFWESLVGQNFDFSTQPNFQATSHYTPLSINSDNGSPIFQYYDIMIIPIQINYSHFALITFEVEYNETFQMSGFKLSYMDSLRYSVEKAILNIMKKYLTYQINKYSQKSQRKQYATKLICEMKILNYIDLNIPEQHNQNDCGVWVCLFIKSIFMKLLGKQINLFSYDELKVDKMRIEIRNCIEGNETDYFKP